MSSSPVDSSNDNESKTETPTCVFDSPCSLSDCVVAIKGQNSNSASPTDVWFADLQQPSMSSSNRDPINNAFIKLFVNPAVWYQYNGATQQNFYNYITLKALEYEIGIYSNIINPIIRKNISPHFIKMYASATSCSYKDMLDILVAGNVIDAEESFRRNIAYIFNLSENRPTINKQTPGYAHGIGDNEIDNLKFCMMVNEQVTANTITFHNMVKTFLQTKDWGQFFIIVFQIAQASNAMYMANTAHNDMHAGNIWVEPIPAIECNYNVNGTLYPVKNIKHWVKVFDFDRAYNGTLGPNIINNGHCEKYGQCNTVVDGKDFVKAMCTVVPMLVNYGYNQVTIDLLSIFTSNIDWWGNLFVTDCFLSMREPNYKHVYDYNTIISNAHKFVVSYNKQDSSPTSPTAITYVCTEEKFSNPDQAVARERNLLEAEISISNLDTDAFKGVSVMFEKSQKLYTLVEELKTGNLRRDITLNNTRLKQCYNSIRDFTKNTREIIANIYEDIKSIKDDLKSWSKNPGSFKYKTIAIGKHAKINTSYSMLNRSIELVYKLYETFEDLEEYDGDLSSIVIDTVYAIKSRYKYINQVADQTTSIYAKEKTYYEEYKKLISTGGGIENITTTIIYNNSQASVKNIQTTMREVTDLVDSVEGTTGENKESAKIISDFKLEYDEFAKFNESTTDIAKDVNEIYTMYKELDALYKKERENKKSDEVKREASVGKKFTKLKKKYIVDVNRERKIAENREQLVRENKQLLNTDIDIPDIHIPNNKSAFRGAGTEPAIIGDIKYRNDVMSQLKSMLMGANVKLKKLTPDSDSAIKSNIEDILTYVRFLITNFTTLSTEEIRDTYGVLAEEYDKYI